MSRDRTSNPDRAGAGGHAAGAHDQADPLQQARSAVELAEGFGLMPGVVVAAEQAIADRSYSAALAATRAWLMQKPHLELLARSMDPQDAFVPRAQALLDRMRALEPKLPRNIFKVGIAELDREDEAEWLAQFGAKPKGQGNASTYADVHGTVDASVGLGPDASVNVGRTSGPNLDLSPGDIAKGVLVPPWALSKPVRRRVLGADQNPIMDGVDDVVDGLINDTDYLSGFVVGAVHGTQAAIRDCQNAPIDLIKLIVGELKKFALDGHYDVLVRLRDMIKQVPAAVELLGRRWTDDSDRHAQGEFQGEVVGYIGTQLAVLIVTSFAGPLAEAFGPYAGVIRAIAAVSDPVSVVREVALGVRLGARRPRSPCRPPARPSAPRRWQPTRRRARRRRSKARSAPSRRPGKRSSWPTTGAKEGDRNAAVKCRGRARGRRRWAGADAGRREAARPRRVAPGGAARGPARSHAHRRIARADRRDGARLLP